VAGLVNVDNNVDFGVEDKVFHQGFGQFRLAVRDSVLFAECGVAF
jgi:hypothetical protein